MESDQGEFDDFATPACNETMNAAELQSEWRITSPVWDEAPSTSSGYRGPASSEMRSQHLVTPQLEEKIEEEIQEKGAVKCYRVVKATFKRESDDGGEERATPYFRSNVQIELVRDSVGDHVRESFTKILEAVDEFIRRDSRWIPDKIVHFELCVAKYQPLRASSYIILPKKLVDKKAVLNIQNEDQKCIIWRLIAHKLNILAHDSFRVSHYTPHEQEIKLDGVECPVPLNKIPIVE
ncbi:hypothetical protein AVEN_231862-1 [Araneus ventricosus]|uniref:Uncharacterized protein n=1 Tax=Araneus ventricosus TaxID=182803 RepID=A0A4Y2UMH4_ARAVE|nr:hypothetical protein AVEN_231862-1 [Araneus ventricosus]